MKHLHFLFLTILTVFVGCTDFDSATQGTSFTVHLVGADSAAASISMAGKTVTLKSYEGRIIQLTTDSTGRAHTDDLIPDLYSISANWAISEKVLMTGSLPQRTIKNSDEVTLIMHQTTISRLLISKVYMAGSKEKNGSTNHLTGSYLEIYNQSDEPIDVAGLYIGLLESDSEIRFTLDQLHEMHADSVVLMKQLFRIPTTTPKLLQPGSTLLLCNSAIDHSEFSDMEHSLLDADYEAKDQMMKITNNKDVPALEAVYLQTTSNMSYMGLTRGGPTGVVIFETNENPLSWPTTYKYPNDATTGAKWLLLPKRLITDGVDILHLKKSGVDIQTKRLYNEIDAGYITLTTINGLDGEVLYRKTSDMKGADGHKMLVDTNNSSNDFQTSKTIAPREYDE